jgi:hypothetical protein
VTPRFRRSSEWWEWKAGQEQSRQQSTDQQRPEVQPIRDWLSNWQADPLRHGPYRVVLVGMDGGAGLELLAILRDLRAISGSTIFDANDLSAYLTRTTLLIADGVDARSASRLQEALSECGGIVELGTAATGVMGTRRRREAISAAVRREVWNRDNGRCVDCGSRDRLEYDHIIPISKGGSNTVRNLELRCESCNRKKGASI